MLSEKICVNMKNASSALREYLICFFIRRWPEVTRKGAMLMEEMPQTPIAINQVLRNIHHKTGSLYDFIMVAGGMLNAIRMRANGFELTMVEIRTIMMIEENPGITATQLCHNWNRSRGAVSQILKKIEQKGFIYKERCKGNDKVYRLYAADEGVEVVNAFVSLDFKDTTNLTRALLETCTEEELRAFYKVIDRYRQVLLERPESRWKPLD